MTRYYSDAIRQERYENARKALDELRGQLLTVEQMSEIFGNYDQGGSIGEAEEDRDAFMQILAGGWLLEDRSGTYRVAGRTRGEAKNINTPEKFKVNDLIDQCALRIRNVVLDQAHSVLERFPSLKFIKYPDYPNTNTKRIIDRSALVLSQDDKGNRRVAVVLTPEGIFEYKYGLAMDYAYLEIMTGTTNPLLWIQYAEQALNELNRL